MFGTVRMFCESAYGKTGISRYIHAMAQRLVNADENIQFLLSCRYRHSIPDLDKLNIRYSTNALPGRIQSKLRNVGIRDSLLYGRNDLVHEPNYVFSRVTSRQKVIITVHDVGWRIDETPYGLTEEFIVEAERAIRRADQLITPTQSVKDDVIQFFNVSPDKIAVILHGVDDQFLSVPDDVPKLEELPELYWLFVGGVTPRKNLTRIILSIANTKQRHPLVVVGPKTEHLNEMTRVARQNGVNVILLHGLEDADLIKVYSHSIGLIYPSMWEGFGLPIIEAAARGTPVVTSNNTAMKEIGEGYAFLVDHVDIDEISHALRSVMNLSAEQRLNMRSRGRQLASRFSWDKSAKMHLAVYQKLLSQISHQEVTYGV